MRKSKRMLLNDCDASRKVVVGFILTPAFAFLSTLILIAEKVDMT